MLKIKSIILVSFGLLLFLGTMNAQTNEDCMMCHEDKDLTAERYGKTVSMYVSQSLLLKSAHSKVECVSCHKDLAGSEFPHVEKLKKVNCGSCHKDYSEQVKNDIHNTL